MAKTKNSLKVDDKKVEPKIEKVIDPLLDLFDFVSGNIFDAPKPPTTKVTEGEADDDGEEDNQLGPNAGSGGNGNITINFRGLFERTKPKSGNGAGAPPKEKGPPAGKQESTED